MDITSDIARSLCKASKEQNAMYKGWECVGITPKKNYDTAKVLSKK